MQKLGPAELEERVRTCHEMPAPQHSSGHRPCRYADDDVDDDVVDDVDDCVFDGADAGTAAAARDDARWVRRAQSTLVACG